MAATAQAHALRALAALLAVGCASSPPEDAAAPDGGLFAMELGQGELQFAPLRDGETLPIAAGPQGGHHVWVAFRMHDLDPARVLVRVTTWVPDHPELELERRGRVNFEPEVRDGGTRRRVRRGDGGGAAGAYVYAGWPAQILEAPALEGEPAHIEVELEDRGGRRARAHKTIVIGTLQ